MIKTQDEITLLNHACMMVDAAYEELYRAHAARRARERVRRRWSTSVLYEMGSEHVEGVNAISGERCSPHPHVFTDRVLRPGRPRLLRHPAQLHGLPHVLLPHVRGRQRVAALVDAYKRCRYYLDAAIALIRPGATTADVVQVWPKAQEFGFPDEEAAFALQFGHGVGLSIWEKPIFSRLVSLEHPEEIREGMVFALETFWPATDGWSAARIEEQLVVTADGCGSSRASRPRTSSSPGARTTRSAASCRWSARSSPTATPRSTSTRRPRAQAAGRAVAP